MICNLGPVGLFKGFLAALRPSQTGAWGQAAEHCVRRGPSAPPNSWTRQQFLTAVVDTIKAETEVQFTRIWGRIRQIWNDLFRRRH